ncbi:MAG: hypothetical protein HOP08_20000 [Cyclobacteriaceae bacterium]|nr:hypothetical protein [Cyclobacteriaceae bacterium]
MKGKIRVYTLLCLMAIAASPAIAQFSNEWINFTQSYYKIPVSQDGIYRISYADLQAAGVPIGSIDPRKINLFHRGNEQSIFVQGQSDASFDPADFIEFYGRRNDGTLDADLYKPSSLQPHPYYNLFSDTTSYFLTWNSLPIQGKRMSLFSETNSSSLPVEIYHTEERLQVYSNEYSGGLTVLGEIQSTAFDQGEGWTGLNICKNLSGCTGQRDFLIDNIVRGVTPSGTPQLELLLAGRDDVSHQVEVYVGPNAGGSRLVIAQGFAGYETVKLTSLLDWSDIGSDGKMIVSVRLTSTSRDQLSLSYAKVNFPQSFDFNGVSSKTISLVPNASQRSYIEIQNSPIGARIWDISDKNNVSMIGTTPISGGTSAVTLSGKKLYISGTTLSPTLRKVSFRSFSPSLHDYIIISNRSLMKPALGYGDAVQSYAAYRASSAGGGYDTLTVPVDQLYNQFNYGETSPRAIYQFMKYMVGGGDPKFLFIIGKGLEVSQGFYRKTSFLPADLRDLVPSAGMPGADMAFTAGLDGTSFEPAVPTGRLTASTPVQVAAYLNKIKETESLPFNDLWRKDLLHLSGGINAGEPEVFRQYVDGFKAIGESFYLGGKIETISKQTLNVELINVKDQVNKGLDLITFFGHSGPGTIDIDIGYVSDPTLGYNNAGKYPGFLINGCNAGRFFDNRVTFGEDWMLTANKGAKSFIAHSSFGFTNTLRLYSDIFYSVAFGDSTFIRKGVGEVQKETGKRYLSQAGADLTSITQVQQMMLLGDPAVALFGARKPDYEINSGSVSIVSMDGNPVTARSDSFAIDIRVRNFGRAQPGLVEVRVTRTLSDNSVVVYNSQVDPILYTDVVRFVVKKGGSTAESGSNNFAITIDPNNLIPELDKTNNTTSVGYFIPLNGTKNLFPSNYAIVNTSSVNLTFQNTDLQADTRSFAIEIDTAATFDSPYLNRKVISGKVIAKMPLTLLTEDSLVYYWRTKISNPQTGESREWVNSSFIFIQNSPEGWSQLKFPQFTEDALVGLSSDPQTKRYQFLETMSTVEIRALGSANAAPYSQTSLKVNQEELNVSTQEQYCRNNTLNLIAFDKSSTAAYAGIPFANFFDPRACGRAPQMINNFLATELETGHQDDLAQWVSNVHPSDSVVIFSIGDAGYASWTTGIKQQLSFLGVGTNQLNGVQPGEPFVIFGKKGSPAGSARIFRPSQAPANAQQVIVNKTITGRYTQGSLSSVVIGPAEAWLQLTSRVAEATANDQYSVEVKGINLAGQETILKNTTAGSITLADIDARIYPYLRLTLKTTDVVDLTPLQLKKWLVTYKPMAEGILLYKGAKQQEIVQEGQEWKTQYAFTNISTRNFLDSLLVQVSVFSSAKRLTQQSSFRIKPPAPGDTSKFSVAVKTSGKAGLNDVTVFVNPKVQPEMYYDNNLLPLYSHLKVEADTRSPLLEVTIDGRQVINGDIVSSSPIILSKVIDRNQFLFKKDTVGINLFLQSPCALQNCSYKRINFSQSDVSWKPATATSDFEIAYHPNNLAAGEYSLRVEAVDASGNRSGSEPYEVTFIVTDKVSFVLQSVYPNPSSDKFNFRILLSGNSMPDNFQLNVYSATGTLVKTFGSEALNVMNIGTNEISMSALDNSGSLLSPGIYLFRIVTSIQGKEFSKSGRLVLIR